MTEVLFNIFGKSTRNVAETPKQCVYNNENIGKCVGKAALDGPVKPQEAMKKPGAAKSFLSNAGKTLQGTPVRQQTKQVFFAPPTPIYSDADCQFDWFEELEFTRPSYKLDKYQLDIFEDSFELGIEIPQHTPPPKTKGPSMEFDCSYEDDFYTDNIYCDMDLGHEDDLPKLF